MRPTLFWFSLVSRIFISEIVGRSLEKLQHPVAQLGMGSTFRHKHLYTFHKFWDVNGDGVLTWDDFRLLAEKYTKIQRRGKLDQDVYKRWESILGKWWDELTEHADFNKDTVVEFDEWLKFFHNLGQQTKSHKELPDFLQTYLQLFFFIMDSNKDGLFCVKDYKKYLSSHDMDVTRAKECFESMLNDEDRGNGNAMTSDRLRELVYDFWVSQNPDSPGKYICGTFDSSVLQELENMTKKKNG